MIPDERWVSEQYIAQHGSTGHTHSRATQGRSAFILHATESESLEAEAEQFDFLICTPGNSRAR